MKLNFKDYQCTILKAYRRTHTRLVESVKKGVVWVCANRLKACTMASGLLICGLLIPKYQVARPVVVGEEMIGYTIEEIEETPEIKVLEEPILYNSNKPINIVSDTDINEAVEDKKDMEILNQLSEAWVEPEAVVQDGTTPREVIMDIPTAISPVGDSSEIDLLNMTEKDTDKITAHCVYIDDKYIGTVENPKDIVETLELLKVPYIDTENLISLRFSKEVTYDKTVSISRSMLTDPKEIADKLLSTEGVERIYEIVPGDCPSLIAEKLGITTDELLKLPVTFNGDVIPDLSEDCRVGMQIKYGSVRKFIHVLVEKDTAYTDMIPYETVVEEDDTMLEGEYYIKTEGEYGMVLRTCREIIDDGTILKSKELSKEKIKSPVTEVIVKGTKVPKTEVNSSKWAGGSGDYFWPIGNNEGYISAYMGDGRGHKGLDIAAPYGTPIYAAHSGYISKVNASGWGGGYGVYIMIAGDDGKDTMYAHMSYVADGVYDGMEVVRGQLIGYVGSTGDSSGNHCHFEVRDGGKYLDPSNFVSR